MPTKEEFEKEIASLLKRIAPPGVQSPVRGGSGNAMELWLQFVIADELETNGNGMFSVLLLNSEGRQIINGEFIQRGNGGLIQPEIKGDKNPGSIYIYLRDENLYAQCRDWELHNSVVFEGMSGVRHEIDISLMPYKTSRYLRMLKSPQAPRCLPILSIESKNYLSKYEGNLDTCREKLARVFECFSSTAVGSKVIDHLHDYNQHPLFPIISQQQIRNGVGFGGYFAALVHASKVSSSGQDMLRWYGIRTFPECKISSHVEMCFRRQIRQFFNSLYVCCIGFVFL